MVDHVADAIRDALLGEGISVVFQPICDLHGDHAVVWWEALARLEVPGIGSMEPAHIVRTARRLGLLDHLTQQVADQSFATMAELVATVGALRAGRGFTVNLEASQLATWTPVLESLVERSRETGIEVMVEITERDLNAWTPGHATVSERLKEAGLSLAIDDFGTGYAALGSLFHAPVDTIKIDRTLASSLEDPRQRLLLQRLIATLHELGFILVVEGVKRIDDLADLSDLGVALVQSFLLAKPMTHDTLLEYARQNAHSRASFAPLPGWPEPRVTRHDPPPAGLTWRERAQRVRDGETHLADVPTTDADVNVGSFFEGILHGSFDGVVVCDRVTGEYLEVSDSFCLLTGFTRAELLGHTSVELGMVEPSGVRRAAEQAGVDQTAGVFNNTIRRADGQRRHVEFSHQYLIGDFVLVIIRDVTSLEVQRQELQRQATHDHLTGVLNRRGFVDVARELLAEVGDASVFLAVADVNRLKELNDELGHETGDEALRRVGLTLVTSAPVGSAIGRLGGDEFALIAPGSPAEGERFAARLTAELDGVTVGPVGHEQPLTMSIGLASGPGNARTVDALVAEADAQMYERKRASADGD